MNVAAKPKQTIMTVLSGLALLFTASQSWAGSPVWYFCSSSGGLSTKEFYIMDIFGASVDDSSIEMRKVFGAFISGKFGAVAGRNPSCVPHYGTKAKAEAALGRYKQFREEEGRRIIRAAWTYGGR